MRRAARKGTMMTDTDPGADLDLFAQLVAHDLRLHRCDRAPARADYSVVDAGRHGTQRPDIQASVDLGRGLCVRIETCWVRPGRNDMETLQGIATEFASGILNLLQDEGELRQIVREVGSAVRREIAMANRRDVTWCLVSVEPSPRSSDRADGPAARVRMEIVGRSPRAEPFEFHACSAEEVVEELDLIRKEQATLARQWSERASVGATGAIDAVLLADLAASGMDVPAVLKRLADSPKWFIDLHGADGTRRVLHWKDGKVCGVVDLGGGARWHQGMVTFSRAPSWIAGRITGLDLGALLEEPRLAGTIVSRCDGKPGGRGTVHCDVSKLLFDAKTGRIWAPEPASLAA